MKKIFIITLLTLGVNIKILPASTIDLTTRLTSGEVQKLLKNNSLTFDPNQGTKEFDKVIVPRSEGYSYGIVYNITKKPGTETIFSILLDSFGKIGTVNFGDFQIGKFVKINTNPPGGPIISSDIKSESKENKS